VIVNSDLTEEEFLSTHPPESSWPSPVFLHLSQSIFILLSIFHLKNIVVRYKLAGGEQREEYNSFEGHNWKQHDHLPDSHFLISHLLPPIQTLRRCTLLWN